MQQKQKPQHTWPISADSWIILFYGAAYFAAYRWFAPATTWRAQNWAYWTLLIINGLLLIANIVKEGRKSVPLSTWQKIDMWLPLIVLLLMKAVDLVVFQQLL